MRTVKLFEASSPEHRRELGAAINQIIDGKGNNTGSVTLTASAASTVVSNARVSEDSHISLTPTTANAATALTTTYVTASNGSFTINHANNAQTDRTYTYSLRAP